MIETIDTWTTKAAGLIGAAIAAVYIGGTRAQIALQVVSGTAASYYTAPWMARQLAAPEGMVGFLLGLAAIFGAKKIIAVVDGLDLKSHLDAALSRLSGKKVDSKGEQ